MDGRDPFFPVKHDPSPPSKKSSLFFFYQLAFGISWLGWIPQLLYNLGRFAFDAPLFSSALTVIYTWLYRQKGGGLLFMTIFHAMSNTIAFVLLELDGLFFSYLFVVGFTRLFAAGIVLFYRAGRFSWEDS
jgi:hypothetical protein